VHGEPGGQDELQDQRGLQANHDGHAEGDVESGRQRYRQSPDVKSDGHGQSSSQVERPPPEPAPQKYGALFLTLAVSDSAAVVSEVRKASLL
jgi:hypothetical protein